MVKVARRHFGPPKFEPNIPTDGVIDVAVEA